MKRNRLLFICKRRHTSGGGHHPHSPHPHPASHPFVRAMEMMRPEPEVLSSGLRNSVAFVVAMLNGIGVPSGMVEVTDNNDIDREVTRLDPTHVFIEAFWVVPEKFDVLKRCHPRVRWIVRNHSETPFLSNEGIAIEWVAGYLQRGIEVNCNSVRATQEMRVIAETLGENEHRVTYLPNFYPVPGHEATVPRPQIEPGRVHVGCFGAIRPLKNQLQQAVGALAFADDLRRPLSFHINTSRVEGHGNAILKNLRALFASKSDRHVLVEHPWYPHAGFLAALRRVDVAMQVSFSETFNIVSADAVTTATPVIVSAEVDWLGEYAQAEPNSAEDIAEALSRAWQESQTQRLFRQAHDLTTFCHRSVEAWRQRFGRSC